MSADINALQNKIDAVVSSHSTLSGAVVSYQDAVANLVSVAGRTKAALVAASGGVDFQPMIDQLQTVIDASTNMTANLSTDRVIVSAAAGADAP